MRSTSAAFRLPDSCTTEERVPDPICSQGSSALASNRAEAISQNTIILPFQEKRDGREAHECSHWLRNCAERGESSRSSARPIAQRSQSHSALAAKLAVRSEHRPQLRMSAAAPATMKPCEARNYLRRSCQLSGPELGMLSRMPRHFPRLLEL